MKLAKLKKNGLGKVVTLDAKVVDINLQTGEQKVVLPTKLKKNRGNEAPAQIVMRHMPGTTLTNQGLLPVMLPNKLDLGCGPNKKVGFCGVDKTSFPGVDVVLDLMTKRNIEKIIPDPFYKDLERRTFLEEFAPWPWNDNSIEEAHSSHCLEHFDAMERIHFINELYRVLKPGAKATLIVPHWSSCRAYGDPTHKWPPVSEFAFFYWKRDWRMANAPHSDITNLAGGFNCNFDVVWGYILEPGVAMRNQEYQQMAMSYYKEACQDIIATMTKA